MSYNCYLFGQLMPQTPAKLTVKIKGQNSTVTLLNEGEINFLKYPGLTEITLPLVFPMMAGSRQPDYYLSLLEKAKTNRTTTQFLMTRTAPNGKLLFDTNITVSVEDYTITENAANGLDVSVEVKLKQYRSYGTKTITITSTVSHSDTKTTTSTSTGSTSTTTTSSSSIAFKVGDVVKITGNTYYTGTTVPSWVKAKNWIVYQVNGDRVVINKSTDGKNAIMSPVKAKDLTLVTAGTTQVTVTNTRSTSTAPKTNTYTVKKGDTLWGIAKTYYGNGAQYTKIYNANKSKIKNPNLKYVGQVLTIP